MNLEDDEFRAKVETLNSFDELLSLLANQTSGEDEDFVRLHEKILSLVTTSQQAIDFWNGSGNTTDECKGAGFDNRVLEKMIDLIRTHEELQAAYYVFGINERELERRHLVRKIFDKADELGFPII